MFPLRRLRPGAMAWLEGRGVSSANACRRRRPNVSRRTRTDKICKNPSHLPASVRLLQAPEEHQHQCPETGTRRRLCSLLLCHLEISANPLHPSFDLRRTIPVTHATRGGDSLHGDGRHVASMKLWLTVSCGRHTEDSQFEGEQASRFGRRRTGGSRRSERNVPVFLFWI